MTGQVRFLSAVRKRLAKPAHDLRADFLAHFEQTHIESKP